MILLECLTPAGRQAKHLPWILLETLTQLQEVDTCVISIVQRGKQRHHRLRNPPKVTQRRSRAGIGTKLHYSSIQAPVQVVPRPRRSVVTQGPIPHPVTPPFPPLPLPPPLVLLWG